MSEGLHDVSQKFFFWRSVEDIRDTMDLKKNMDLATLKDVLSLRMGSTVAGQIRKRVSDPRVAQMLDHFVQYVGSSPYNSPAVLCSIGHMQTDGGVWYPMGGTRAVPVALAKLADELGVETRLSTGIRRIVSDRGVVSAVETEAGETVPVSGAGVQHGQRAHLCQELVGGKPAASFAKRWKRDPACSGVVLYLGLNKGYDHLAASRLRLLQATRRKSSTGSTTRASPPPTRPATSPPPPAPSPAWPRPAARRSMSWCTRPICARITTGRRCCPNTAR